MKGAALYDCAKSINDAFRTALMNRKYYGHRLTVTRSWNVALDIIIAVGASSAVGTWLIWKKSPAGENAWAMIAGLAALLAVIKPFLNLPKQLEKYSKLFIGHGDVYYDLKAITTELARVRDYTPKVQEAHGKAFERIKQLAPEDDPKIKEKLRRRFFEEVNREIPVESLWWPKKPGRKGGK
ncbi:MAG: hypothetical protein A2Y86_03305 [Candidatus Aminicenantes bacterium RBG_13_62_12]|nr:MAG: hypothetical protein A2Y86_03305 [Candidatus Aminicenantes bacterium RBG_13_62_12]OGD33641.1 MAG: hypothetical protein A2V45_02125 [Candidatus Aminicenantes bacterium RBG_19FT_COMBO_58_17]